MRWNSKQAILMVIFALLVPFCAHAQKKAIKKYPALLWQITGNGLTKPSYLFGTMHVSNKMVFNLSDSFYLGIKNADVVALELDPQLWQDQMYRFQIMQTALRFYTKGSPNDYLNEKSFQIENYEEKLRAALSEEPTLINGLLYRTFQQKADFEEDTYLDLYIYQTGKKFGKQATGVENYFETEKLILEATQDMMMDKKKRNSDGTEESAYDLEKKTETAYRRGDLDLLDSLERLMIPSDVYLEKFLYKRNEIQAKSIDSILKKQSLFVGVGAAHLPGKRGVIELLRSMGYKLRPIASKDRDEAQRDVVDKIKVPVHFSSFTAEDGSFSVELPGKLYKRLDSRFNDSWQYADMSNGAYYMVTRVKTYKNMIGQTEEAVLKKLDSLLYENIPGKIIKKQLISKGGFKGYDITNKTRRGDIQRYNIFITPFEVLVFKISGNGTYVEGEEANKFLGSIELRKKENKKWADFEPVQGGFKVKLPTVPLETMNKASFDGVARWEYESNDSANGDAYLIFKKSIQNYRFLEEDTFCLSMMQESFGHSDCIDKLLYTKQLKQNGRQAMQADYRLKDGSYLKARYFINGPHYYLLAARSKSNKTFSDFFESFSFVPFRYSAFKNYVDSFVAIQVTSPVIPEVDVHMRKLFERTTSEEFLNSAADYSNYWPRNKSVFFQDDSTGEAVYVSMSPFPKYYYPKDTVNFWKDEMNEDRINDDLIIKSKKIFPYNDSLYGYRYVYSDTGSSSIITNWSFTKGNRLYRVISLNDSLLPGKFYDRFLESIRPYGDNLGNAVFENKLDIFFQDLFSSDSTNSKKAKEAIPNVYFGPKGAPRLLKAINSMPYNNVDYFATKTKLINELGFIRDSSSINQVVEGLKNVYEKTTDTSTFQNAVIKALAKNKTKESYALLKSLLLQDPPVFDNSSDADLIFQDIDDTLSLARSLFPEILQLSTIDDYKDDIRSLLTKLVDSNYVKTDDYKEYFNKIYFDAKIQLKKQMIRDESKSQKKEDDDNDTYGNDPDGVGENAELMENAILLMPFYDKNPTVPKFFDKLLQTKDANLKLNTAVLLLRNNKNCPDSVLQSLAKDDKYRFQLYEALENVRLEKRFPEKLLVQQEMAKSALINSSTNKNLFALEFVGKRYLLYKQKNGWVYFFRYKAGKNDENWQMGISGLQPEDIKKVSSSDDLVALTNKKIKKDRPEIEQFEEQLKRLLFSKHKSAASFYLDNDYYMSRNQDDN
jgi:uncharacterized protein YbaP (TraB family)